MKLIAGLIAALAGCATAAQQSAEVYIVSRGDVSSPPAVTPSLARLLILQRLASNGQGFLQYDIPDGVDTEKAMSFLNRFGKSIPSLFSAGETTLPNQLVLMLDVMSDSHMKELRKALSISPSFTIADPPADRAHKELIELDLIDKLGVADGNKCSIQQIANPMENCWNGKSSVVAKYSMNKDPEIFKHVAKQVAQLVQLAKSGDLETTIIALPSTRSSSQWSEEQQELRRRQAEQVMSAIDKPKAEPQTTSPSTPEPVIFAPSGRIASCYDTESACNEATRNCTGHGACKDKYASGDGAKTAASCFACHCQATRNKNTSLTHWGGSSCAKQDVSVPFWLFAGFTLAMVGILSMSVGLLYSVGEEKLPGVIGAGVSRNK
ncbi:hypothetical protein C2857_007533 [Epichloe festucae Fl1]|uniref:Vacuolar sorting protein Vps3844 C-terminal domain-containing protein n=1 Tax=Epichloe festucae (strain Fl1) TaxID=877507 RepID=A0A7S9PT33_EPIFF|nr:hypothetical protein C2857_007533 [Epichloe festucae Fl1]